MAASEAQIRANRANASRSTGPKTSEGKARSRANATRHGMAGESAELEAVDSPEFLRRREEWAEGRGTLDKAGRWALDRAVAASLRVERCERALDQEVAHGRRRAQLAWDEDRALEAEEVAARLAQEPALTCRRLQTSLAGVRWLLEAWFGLLDALEGGGDWSAAQSSRALDLLGIPPDRREGAAADAATDVPGQAAESRSLAEGEIARLEALRDESFAALDEAERDLAMAGDRAILSKPARLILRYERDAWRRYREAMKQVEAPPPARPAAPRPEPPAPGPAADSQAVREASRAPMKEIAARGSSIPARVELTTEEEDAAWLDALEGRLEAEGSMDFEGDGTNPIRPAKPGSLAALGAGPRG